MSIDEKPYTHSLVSGGIYVLEPSILPLIPHSAFYDMPDLISSAIDADHKVCAFPVYEQWIDIGSPGSFALAQETWSCTSNVHD